MIANALLTLLAALLNTVLTAAHTLLDGIWPDSHLVIENAVDYTASFFAQFNGFLPITEAYGLLQFTIGIMLALWGLKWLKQGVNWLRGAGS